MVELITGNGLVIYLIAILFFIWVFFRNLGRYKHSKQKIVKNYYLRAVILSILMVIVAVLGIINRVILSLVLFFILAIISVILLPATIKARRVENEKILAHVHSKDLALADFFTQKGWLKLAQRLGCWNATVIVFMISLVLLFAILLGVDLLIYGEFSLIRVFVSDLVMSLLSSAFFYLTVKKTRDKVIFWGR